MQFQMNRAGRRSELRQMIGNTEAAWDVNEGHTMGSAVLISPPNPIFSEFTFLQIHCSAKPDLRVVREKSRDGRSDVVVAVLRTGEGSSDIQKTVLASRPMSVTGYEVSVGAKRVAVKINGRTMYERTLAY